MRHTRKVFVGQSFQKSYVFSIMVCNDNKDETVRITASEFWKDMVIAVLH